MGAGIAQVSAQKGYNVVLKDKDLKGLSRGEQQIAGNIVRAGCRQRAEAMVLPLTTSLLCRTCRSRA